MSYHVSTAVFEGPLDLLLQLINRHQVDIAEVNLTGLVTEYLGYMEELAAMDLDVTSEFLLIAATLIQLKAQRLLPHGTDLDPDEELALMEERDRLLSRLLMCVTFKDVAAVFLRRWQETNRFVPHTGGVDQTIAVRPLDVSLPVDANRLAAIAAKAFARSGGDPDLDHLDLELPSVEEAMEDLRARMALAVEATFEQVVAECQNPLEISAYFLAVLELARWGLLRLDQEHWLAPITIRRVATADLDSR
jgi:segregation and condensation protein A